MKIWDKIKKAFEGPKCVRCHNYEAMFNGGPRKNCYWDDELEATEKLRAYEREERIKEMVEAILKASPVEAYFRAEELLQTKAREDIEETSPVAVNLKEIKNGLV